MDLIWAAAITSTVVWLSVWVWAIDRRLKRIENGPISEDSRAH